MTRQLGNFDDFGMATATLPGPLEAKLAAIRAAGFSQVMVEASDLAAHPVSVEAAVQVVKASGLRVTGLQWLRDYEGLTDRMRAHKREVAQAMLRMAQQLGAPLLLVASSTNRVASQDLDVIAADLRTLAMLAVPPAIRIAYEGMSWGRTVTDFSTAWDVVCRADMPNLGLALDSGHTLVTGTPLDDIEMLDPGRVFAVRLADFMEPELPTDRPGPALPRQSRVFPGEGMHRAHIAEFVMRLAAIGYRGDYSFEVFNEDDQQLPRPLITQRARAAAQWLGEDVLHRSVPLPGSLRVLRPAAR